MKATAVVAVILIALGVVALLYEGITYTQSRKVLEVGPVVARVEEKKTIPVPPVLGVVAIAGGVLLLVLGRAPRVA